MDITLAKTFLAIIDAGNFREAATRLNVTQSTISARVKSLEDQLGRSLFVRNKSGASLTQAGENFQEYALSFIQLWERALHKMSTEDSYQDHVCIGARPALWEPIIMKWLPWARTTFPDVAYRVEFGIAEDLNRKLAEGIIDMAIILSAPTLPGVLVEKLYQENFLLVARTGDAAAAGHFTTFKGENYIDVEWGKEFREAKRHYFPESLVPQLSFSVGIYGVKYILEHGGYGYFPQSMVAEYIESGEMSTIEDAPTISQPVYLASCKDVHNNLITPLLEGFRAIGKTL
ncbi:LysR family transcriptional regulator [Paremcibacter congregatus]|uniref:HTH lysR-type domain-containing protein n=1 Tax=Paremcibacter congregatus TaxID=2043170 RepID=A0A2G4YSB4_9PROT|nr:LysR family transcriptional regulator [Paremcibacter congregatus]PHZ85234.1 hypothetical protein CRD36_07445 [Paremcibacter congregatus]QDE27832.1 LysR family transcriptional regulator [Paremcibacter congregatus]